MCSGCGASSSNTKAPNRILCFKQNQGRGSNACIPFLPPPPCLAIVVVRRCESSDKKTGVRKDGHVSRRSRTSSPTASNPCSPGLSMNSPANREMAALTLFRVGRGFRWGSAFFAEFVADFTVENRVKASAAQPCSQVFCLFRNSPGVTPCRSLNAACK